jgi:hypothetical protein
MSGNFQNPKIPYCVTLDLRAGQLRAEALAYFESTMMNDKLDQTSEASLRSTDPPDRSDSALEQWARDNAAGFAALNKMIEEGKAALLTI